MSGGMVSRAGAKPSAGWSAPPTQLRPSTKGSSIKKLRPKFGAWPRAHGNADKIRVCAQRDVALTPLKMEHSGTKLPESARRVPEFLPERSPDVRRCGGAA